MPGTAFLGTAFFGTVLLVCGLALMAPLSATAAGDASLVRSSGRPSLRIGTFNVKELSREKLDAMDALGRGTHPQLRAAAAIVQHVRPDVLVLNEIDFDAGERRNARLFVERYLRVAQKGQCAIDYPHVVFLPTNTGVLSGLDLNHDGDAQGPEDAWGFGRYPGQYGMALLSQIPIAREQVRTFRRLPWRDMPGNLMPDGTGGKPDWYGAAVAAVLRLSSKSHWDVPLRIRGRVLHLLISHPTPPVFDGDEDRNGRRNFDELRLWKDYVTGGQAAGYLVDDRGRRGGLDGAASFVILGDLNADPVLGTPFGNTTAGGTTAGGTTAIGQLLAHPRIQDPSPRSAGARLVDRVYAGDGALRTAAFGRADYVLPSADLELLATGVFWPGPEDPMSDLVAGPDVASDHHLVWVDLSFE